MSPWRFVPNVLGIFKGTYRHDTLALDFVGDDFMVTLLDDECYPFQHSGDAAGDRVSWRVRVAGTVQFVDLLGMPAPVADLELVDAARSLADLDLELADLELAEGILEFPGREMELDPFGS